MTSPPCLSAHNIFYKVAESQVQRSSRNGRGSGGRIAQMRNLEEMQFASAVPKSKHVAYLEVATRGQEVNPMAPTSAPQSSEIGASRPRPRPRLKTKYRHTMSTQPSGHDGKSVQPSFALAAPSDQFGFKLPNTSQFESSAHSSGPPGLSSQSVAPSSRASSIFSEGLSHASTPPTSRAASICSSARSGLVDVSSGHSSHLRLLALGSQSGMEAPAQVSRVEDVAHGFKESSQVQSVGFDQHQNTSVAGAVSTCTFLSPRTAGTQSGLQGRMGAHRQLKPFQLRYRRLQLRYLMNPPTHRS